MSYPTMPTPKAPDPAVAALQARRAALADHANELRLSIAAKEEALTLDRSRLNDALEETARLLEAVGILEHPAFVVRDE